MTRKLVVVALAALLAFALPAVAADPDGAAIYKAKCASCHGADGSANTPFAKKVPMRDLGAADVQKQTDKELYDWTAVGKAKMPAYASKLSEQEINALVTYMRTLKK